MLADKPAPVNVKEFSNYEIAWSLLMIILRSHDPAGVSLGRSRRNDLLRNAVRLLGESQLVMDQVECQQTALFQEAFERMLNYNPLVVPQQMLLPFAFAPEYLDNKILAQILLARLRDWYEEDELTNRFGFISEMNLLFPALILIGLDEGIYLDLAIWRLSTEAILKESRERDFRTRFQVEIDVSPRLK